MAESLDISPPLINSTTLPVDPIIIPRKGTAKNNPIIKTTILRVLL